MGHVKIKDVSETHLNNATTPYDCATGFTVTILLPHKSALLNISLRDDKSHNLPILNKLLARHVWRKYLPYN